jgi:GT2 family glycosyltransferase
MPLSAKKLDNIGGFTEDYGLGHEDWEFFAKVSLQGYKLQLVLNRYFGIE